MNSTNKDWSNRILSFPNQKNFVENNQIILQWKLKEIIDTLVLLMKLTYLPKDFWK